MTKLIVASTRPNAGKTSLIAGLAEVLRTGGQTCGYFKPFGDRLVYKKKRLWDYDSALLTQLWGLTESPDEMSLGFEHSKLKYMFEDKSGMREKLTRMAADVSQDKDLLFIEGGRDLTYGESLDLDAISVARDLGGTLVIVAAGNDGVILDDIAFLKKHTDLTGVKFAGIVLNKVHDLEDFKETHLPEIEKMGIPVLGMFPYTLELTHATVEFLSERLFAKVVAGEQGMNGVIKNILVGAMSVDSPLMESLLQKENKLMITSGDRSDMILAALESKCVAVVLTNNILPPTSIISKAGDKGIPLLLVPYDTFETARQIDSMEPLLTKGSRDKITLLRTFVEKNKALAGLLK